jgi:hypothetical protein
MELHIGWSAVVPDGQGNPGNIIRVAAVSFLATKNLKDAKSGE